MERLTERNEYGYPYTGIETNCVNGSYDIENPEWVDVAISRLADIEDILGDDYNLDHLRELVQADQKSRKAQKPCKICGKYEAFVFKAWKSKRDIMHHPDCGGGVKYCPRCGRYLLNSDG